MSYLSTNPFNIFRIKLWKSFILKSSKRSKQLLWLIRVKRSTTKLRQSPIFSNLPFLKRKCSYNKWKINSKYLKNTKRYLFYFHTDNYSTMTWNRGWISVKKTFLFRLLKKSLKYVYIFKNLIPFCACVCVCVKFHWEFIF